ncbi:hypothetical protein BUALT_Bualt18G0016200 [Buddleja alternifolia]|uniref:Glabrous enhancer-binding protein-like DBD domain-containing protein n=1 Tax=Buddleja alternifolia TaxID=168488 RepID=A0AAV6W2T2_9LAMI|nr:hypothetical protein BUALT_Bualt18G0016200 [Buddleja alternifolia]
MAPKIPPQSRQPSKEKDENEQPSDDVEESQSDSDSEADSSAEEEEEEEGSSEEEHEDHERRKSDKTPIPPPKFESKSTILESGSDSDPESEVNASDYKIQPVIKPHAPPSKRAAAHQEVDSSKSSKRLKTEEKKPNTASAGGCITRLWSNEDEIAVLNGMVDFKTQKGVDPNANMAGFHNYVKGKLMTEFSRDQLKTKISRMKKRFFNALKKGENGEDPVLSNPHEYMAFEISKKIWGGGVGNSEGGKSVVNENAKKEIVKEEKIEKGGVEREEDGEERDFWSKYPFFSASFRNVGGNFPSLATSEVGLSFLKEKLSLIGNVKAKELDEKWKKLFLEETELNHKMLTLMTEQVKMAFS